MKVLHISTSDIDGGAAKAALRLHTALNNSNNCESYMLVRTKKTSDVKIIEMKSSNRIIVFICKLWVKIYRNYIKLKYKPSSIFSTNRIMPSFLGKVIKKINPDIIHLHWIADQFVDLHSLLALKKPILWTLHDSWPITGGCHINNDCVRFTLGCGRCPVLNSLSDHDLSSIQFKIKQQIYGKLPNLIFNALSTWMLNNIQKSGLVTTQKIISLPNVLNTNFYAPIVSDSRHNERGLPNNKKIILFGAVQATFDKNKGFDLLLAAINLLQHKRDLQLIIFGASTDSNLFNDFSVEYVGVIKDEESLKRLYNVADVMIVPSRQETLPQTAVESLSCGTPVVAFATTGLLDIVDHKKNGYLAQPFDPEDLAHGIQWILYHDNYTQLCQNARDKALRNFSEDVLVPQYLSVYNELL